VQGFAPSVRTVNPVSDYLLSLNYVTYLFLCILFRPERPGDDLRTQSAKYCGSRDRGDY